MIEIKREISGHTDSIVNNHTQSSEKSQTRKVTIMVVVLVGVFVLCNITNFIWWMMKNFIQNFNPPGVFTCFTDFAETLSSSVNIIVYGIFGEKFRKTFYELFCPPCFKRDAQRRKPESIPLMRRHDTLKTSVTLLSSTKIDQRDV